MDWWPLTLLLTGVVCCHASPYRIGARTEVQEVLSGRVMVLLDFPSNGPPTPHCEYPYYMRERRRLTNTEVVDLPSLKARGYRLRLEPAGRRSLSCSIVNVDEDPQCTQMTCPFGWSLLYKTCFLVTSFVGTWEEGHSFCQQHGGTLATVSTNAQQTALSRLLSRDTWIGLKLKEHSYIYSWADGSDYTYTSWGNGDPSSLDTPDPKGCVEMREKYNFQWNDADCDQLKLSLCSSSAIALTAVKNNRNLPPATSEAPSTSRCPAGWIRFRSSCYKVFFEELSYDGAKAACRRLGASLASIHSEEEESFIRNHMRAGIYIGLTDRQEEGKFIWDDGSAITYTRWDEGEPNDHDGMEDCAMMRASESRDGRWNDIMCSVELHYACKKSKTQDGDPEPTPTSDYHRVLFHHDYHW